MPQESITSNSKINIQMGNVEKDKEKSNNIVRKRLNRSKKKH